MVSRHVQAARRRAEQGLGPWGRHMTHPQRQRARAAAAIREAEDRQAPGERVWVTVHGWIAGRQGRYHRGRMCRHLWYHSDDSPPRHVPVEYAAARGLTPCSRCCGGGDAPASEGGG
jgi:hypothetical protein